MAETKSSVEPDLLPQIVTPIPGPKSREMAEQLGRVEGQAITALSPPPIFWSRANGSNIWDADGNRYIDLTAAFGVANVGHAHPEIVEAFHLQAQTLLHGFGDVHPSETKLALLRRLVELFRGAKKPTPYWGPADPTRWKSLSKRPCWPPAEAAYWLSKEPTMGSHSESST